MITISQGIVGPHVYIKNQKLTKKKSTDKEYKVNLRILFEVLSGGAFPTSLKDKEKKTSQ